MPPIASSTSKRQRLRRNGLPSCDGIALAYVGTNAPLRRQKKAFKAVKMKKPPLFSLFACS